MEFFTNPWVIGIGVAVIAGLILYFVFGIGKPKQKHPSDNPAAITNKSIQQNVQSALPSVSVGNANKNVTIHQNIQQNTQAVLSSVPVETSKFNIFPEQIFQYLASLPPLQRDAAAQNYIGIKVSWSSKLINSYMVGEKQYLMLAHGDSILSNITCQIDLTKYPGVKVLKEGHPMIVEGTVKSVSSNHVYLQDCTFTF